MSKINFKAMRERLNSSKTSKTKEKYTSQVSEEYRTLTKNDLVRYTIPENIAENSHIIDQITKNKKEVFKDFNSIYVDGYAPNLFDIRLAEIREDNGQRNCLTDQSRRSSLKRIYENFDSRQFNPIKIHRRKEADGSFSYLITDGGMSATCAYLHGIFEVPAIILHSSSPEDTRKAFISQDDNNRPLSKYDKYRNNLGQGKKRDTDLFNFSQKVGIRLDHQETHIEAPVIAMGLVMRARKKCKEESVVLAIKTLKKHFPEAKEIEGSVMEGFATFIDISPEINLNKKILDKFIKTLKNEENMSNLSNWTKELDFDSSNKYATLGAARFCEKFNEIFAHQNKGRHSFKIEKYSDKTLKILTKDTEYVDDMLRKK